MMEIPLDLEQLLEASANKAIAKSGSNDLRFREAGPKKGDIYYIHFIDRSAGNSDKPYPSVYVNIRVLHTHSTG
ncbi:MAG: hypothetical protein WBP93_14830, partial [Pyrinomonadaceae bacterium]